MLDERLGNPSAANHLVRAFTVKQRDQTQQGGFSGCVRSVQGRVAIQPDFDFGAYSV